MPAISRNGKFLTKTKTQADIGGVPSVRLYEKQTGSQGSSLYTVFTLSGSYVPGSNTLVVYVNGQKAERVISNPTNSTQYVETNSKTVTFGSSLQPTDIIEFAIYGSYNVSNREWNTNTYETTLTEATDNVTLPFTPDEGMISIYIDGVRQLSEAYSVSGTSVTFYEVLPVGTKLLFVSPNTDDIPLTNADTLDGYHANELIGRKNLFINGAFDVWQRGSSFSNLTSATYGPDRFFYGASSDGSINITRNTDVPSVSQAKMKLNYSVQLAVNTADTSIGSSQYSTFSQIIEGYDIKNILGKYITISFWIKSNKTGTYCFRLSNSGGNLSYVSEFTINSANTWEKKIITIQVPENPSGTWNYTNGVGLRCGWTLAAGSSFHTTANSWNTGNFLSTSNQVNFLDNSTNLLRIAQAQLEVGQKATEFEYRPFMQELKLCQRYYEKSYALETGPGSVTSAGAVYGIRGNGAGVGYVSYKVSKRDAAVVTVYSTQTGASGNVRNLNTSTDQASSTFSNSEYGFNVYPVSASINDVFAFQWTASAEL